MSAEKLPPGWVAKMHTSGIFCYVHKETDVVLWTKPSLSSDPPKLLESHLYKYTNDSIESAQQKLIEMVEQYESKGDNEE